MVHIDNVEHILRHGLYSTDQEDADPDYINIGDNGLIAQRREFEVPIDPGGNLGEYLPFYFGGHSPMLLNIKTGHRGITRRPQYDIVYFVCRVSDIIETCENWVFTDGHAKDAFTEFYNNIDELANVVDWDIVKEQWWRNTEDDYDRQRRKQAEFLIKSHVPVSCIRAIVVKNQNKKDQIELILNNLNLTIQVRVDINNQLYYP